MNYNTLKSNLEFICGINPVHSLLKTNAGRRKIYEIYLAKSKESNACFKEIFYLIREKGIKLNILEDEKFERLIANPQLKAQGICAKASNYSYHDIDNFLVGKLNKYCRLLILDGVTDSGNFGAIIRSAFAFEFDGIIIPKHRSVQIGKDTSRISAGTLEEMKIFQAANLASTIKKLKENRFWIYGTGVEENENVKLLSKADFSFPMALILGGEHKGISRLSKENSDFLIKIDINKELDSLNVSVAAGIILYQIYMQISKIKQAFQIS